MPLSINTNIASLTAQRAITTQTQLETAYERLSSVSASTVPQMTLLVLRLVRILSLVSVV